MGVPITGSFWSDDNRATLRRMWIDGATTAEIGRVLGCTKNAVIGRARREGLPARESPIKDRKCPQTGRRISDLREAKRPEIERMLREGHGVNTVKTAMHVAEEFVREIRDLAGIPVLKTATRKPSMPTIYSPAQNVIPFPAPPPPKPKPSAPVFAAPAGFVPGMVRKCQWPFGHPGTKSFRFCEAAPVVLGRSYCEEHCRMAYVPRRAESEVA